MGRKYCSFKPVLSPYALDKPIDWAVQFQRDAPLDVEIGFGMGEVLIRMARESSERNFVGIEQHWERIYKTLRAITVEQKENAQALQNIRILKVDARVVFERLFNVKTIDRIYCLFPCPWPKKGHVKHRLFSNNFLRLLNSRLKKGGELKIVTDFYPYYEWILGQVHRSGFHVQTKEILPQYDTKFERKWREEGQEKFYELNFVKKRHIDVPVSKDVELKSYIVDDFEIKNFQMVNETGATSVIFKNILYDRDKKSAMVLALVAEEYMTQHVWINIISKKNKWCIARADGQNFFPTAGIARAIELVYAAARKSSSAPVLP